MFGSAGRSISPAFEGRYAPRKGPEVKPQSQSSRSGDETTRPGIASAGPTPPGLFANSTPTSNCISDSWPDRALDLAILVAVRVPDEPGAFGHLARTRVVTVRPQPQL